MKHYRDRQVYAQIEALTGVTEIGVPVEVAGAAVAAEAAGASTETGEVKGAEMEVEHSGYRKF